MQYVWRSPSARRQLSPYIHTVALNSGTAHRARLATHAVLAVLCADFACHRPADCSVLSASSATCNKDGSLQRGAERMAEVGRVRCRSPSSASASVTVHASEVRCALHMDPLARCTLGRVELLRKAHCG